MDTNTRTSQIDASAHLPLSDERVFELTSREDMRATEKQAPRGGERASIAQRKHSRARVANAWAASFITVLFLAHACLGTVKLYWPDMPSKLEIIVWAGVVVIVAHIALSIVTTYEVWTDTERPASDRKKRHHILKWVTGGLLAVAIIVHQLCVWQLFPADITQVLAMPTLIVTAILLCAHLSVGIKSLTRDLNLSSSLRTPAKAVFILATVAVCVAVAALMLR